MLSKKIKMIGLASILSLGVVGGAVAISEINPTPVVAAQPYTSLIATSLGAIGMQGQKSHMSVNTQNDNFKDIDVIGNINASKNIITLDFSCNDNGFAFQNISNIDIKMPAVKVKNMFYYSTKIRDWTKISGIKYSPQTHSLNWSGKISQGDITKFKIEGAGFVNITSMTINYDCYK